MRKKEEFIRTCRKNQGGAIIDERSVTLFDIEEKSKQLLHVALKRGASDLHISSLREKGWIQLRINGRLESFEKIKLPLAERLVSHFKFAAGLDIGERRKPQSGAMELLHRGQSIHLRISTLPTPSFETLSIRIHFQDDRFSLDTLPLFPSRVLQLKQLTKASQGLILVTGPTGSGKTTTLYSLLQYTSAEKPQHIITIEDPIEYTFPTFTQVEINEKAGVTFETGLKAALRHDPDVLMVGEIRDRETAELAVRAALTGHLVYSTLHTNDAKGAILRLHEMGVPLSHIKEVLMAVVAQRLVTLSCYYCEGACDPHCQKENKRGRAAIFDILQGDSLARHFQRDKGPSENKLLTEWRKAFSLGFIKAREGQGKC